MASQRGAVSARAYTGSTLYELRQHFASPPSARNGCVGPWHGAAARQAAAADTTVGFIYVGPHDDYGYNQAHADGAAALKKMPGVKVVEEEKVPETDAVEKTMESMINLDGATLLFPTSFGYFDPHMLMMAKKYPKSVRALRRPVDDEGPEERRQLFRLYRRGPVRQRHRRRLFDQIRKLGFVAAKPIPQVLRNINALLLGAKLANPKITRRSSSPATGRCRSRRPKPPTA